MSAFWLQIASIFQFLAFAAVLRQGGFLNELNQTKVHDDHARPLTGKRLAAFCYLKQKLMSKYRLHPMHPMVKGGRKECALVSSSGALLKHSHGADIDDHEVVCRFNKAPVAGFAKYVGSKTSFRVGWDFPAGFPKESCIPIPSHPMDATGALRGIYPDAKKTAESSDVTSGFHGMLLALTNCRALDAYEMAPSKAAAESPYSYYSSWGDEKGGATYNGWHGYFSSEKELWLFLSTTPESEIERTGKASFTCFDDVECADEASLLAQLPREMVASLTKLVNSSERK